MAVKERPRHYPGVKIKPLQYDEHNPLYAMEVIPVGDGTGRSVIKHWMAFDPYYGPESEKQIEWHVAHGTPGAETWEVGKPIKFKRIA